MIVCALVLATFCFSVRAAGKDPKRGLNTRLFVVPVPGEVTIDGELDDWDLSGQILSYNSEETRGRKNGRMALMYDDEALYIGARVQDPNPMMNRHDPEANPDKVWNADSVQVRLIIDRDEGYPVNYAKYRNAPDGNNVIQHLLLWYYTDGQSPWLQLRKDMDYKVPQEWEPYGLVSPDGFEAAYRKHEDGLGYTLEYRIPWETLDAENPPQAGDVVAGSIQYNWSKPSGLRIDAGKAPWARDVVSGGGFPYQSASCWGKFIFAETNDIPPLGSEATEEVEKPTPLSFDYELSDDGVVTVSLWDQDDVLVRNVVCQKKREAGTVTEKWDGLDFKGDPIPEGEYQWKGIYHDPITTEFLLSVHNSGNPPYKTADGTGGWGADHGDPTTVERYGDQMILAWKVGEAGRAIIRVTADGQKEAAADRGNATVLAVDENGHRVFAANSKHGPGHVKLFDARDFRPINFPSGRGQPERPTAGKETKGITVSGLAYGNGRLYVAYRDRNLVAVNDGKSGDLIETRRVPQPGRIALAPNGSLLAISGEQIVRVGRNGTSAVADDHLDEPAGIDIGPDGRIYVTNRGGRQNVAVFSPKGKHIRDIGLRGGRPRLGRFNPAGMLQPAGCAVGPDNRLWVAENIDYPKRVSVWSTQSGENVAEYFGASAYSPTVSMDPNHPDEVYCHNVLWKVALDEGTKAPYSTLWRPLKANQPPAPSGGFGGVGIRVFTGPDNRQYGSRNNVLYRRDGPIFKPIVMFFRKGEFPVTAESDRYEKGIQYAWIDRNGNQTIDPPEIQQTARVGKRGGGFTWVDEDLNLYTPTTGRYGRQNGLLWSPHEIRENGTPDYDFQHPESLPFAARNRFTPVWTDPQDGALYQNSTVRKQNRVAFGRWTTDGDRLWGIPGTLFWKRTIGMKRPGPGDMYALTAGLGVAGDFTGVATYYSGYHILTRDGQYVSMIMNPPASEGLGPNKLLVELFTGNLIRLTESGRYLLLTGDQDGRVMEVHGLDTVRELGGGTWTMTDERLARVQKARQKYQERKASKQVLVINRGKDQLKEAGAVRSMVDAELGFAARAARDAENLYVRFDVTSPHPLTNSISDPTTMFTGGNCLDIQMATDPNAREDREEPAPGDLRLLITRQNGKTKAVLFEPEVDGFDGEPIKLESPVDEETFDRITLVHGVTLDYEPAEDGFRATVTIPLDILDWKPVSGQGVKMDLGYVFGDDSGRNALARTYWSNNGFEANIVDDIPDESRLNPEFWGTAVVE